MEINTEEPPQKLLSFKMSGPLSLTPLYNFVLRHMKQSLQSFILYMKQSFQSVIVR